VNFGCLKTNKRLSERVPFDSRLFTNAHAHQGTKLPVDYIIISQNFQPASFKFMNTGLYQKVHLLRENGSPFGKTGKTRLNISS
jgi:hypothetical protein